MKQQVWQLSRTDKNEPDPSRKKMVDKNGFKTWWTSTTRERIPKNPNRTIATTRNPYNLNISTKIWQHLSDCQSVNNNIIETPRMEQVHQKNRLTATIALTRDIGFFHRHICISFYCHTVSDWYQFDKQSSADQPQPSNSLPNNDSSGVHDVIHFTVAIQQLNDNEYQLTMNRSSSYQSNESSGD